MRKTFSTIFLLICILVQLTGCGYHFGQGQRVGSNRTLSIPYVVGDRTGQLTSALVKEMTSSGAYLYQRDDADYTLLVTIISSSDKNIGFRYDRDEDGKLTDSIIPTETRAALVVEVSLVDNCANCVTLGPARISANVDFDHDYFFSRDGVNVFSLGQLTDYDAAIDAVQRPLNKAISEKIVDYVIHSW